MIAHLDCDAFYATVELIRRPELKGKPVIVAGSGPRAVVTTASYEARKFGVGSAMPASQARRLCPTAIVIPPDFIAYREKSRDVWKIVRARLEAMQSMGLDEAYADLTGVEKPLRVLREVIEQVKKQTGIQISVGVGPSRLVAKCCSDLGKPAGLRGDGPRGGVHPLRARAHAPHPRDRARRPPSGSPSSATPPSASSRRPTRRSSPRASATAGRAT